MTGRHLVGIDLGGTNIVAARVDLDRPSERAVRKRAKRSTPTGGVDDVVRAVAAAVAEVSSNPGIVGIGTPGVIEPDGVTVAFAPNLVGFERPVDFGTRLAAEIGAPVVLGNDVDVAALAEGRLGSARAHEDVLALWLGTGLGGGLVLDGRLRVGRHGLAGELGHVVVVPDGRRCPCGGSGHLEAYIGRRAMEARVRELHGRGRVSALVERAPDRPMKSKDFASAYADGDAVAVEVLEEGFDMLAVVVGNVMLTVDVGAVVIGGGLGERLADPVTAWIGASLAALPTSARPQVLAAALGDDAGALGAAVLAADQLGSVGP